MKKLNILFADDSPSVGLLVSTYLREAGHAVTHVTSGEAAVANFRDQPFDLILMDVVMPGMGGLEAIKQIKAIHMDAWVPVIIVTSRNSDEDLMGGFMAGADDYLLKPINMIALDLRIRSMMRVASIQHGMTAIVDGILEGLIEIDVAGRISRFNKAAERIFGYSFAEVRGRNVNMLMPSPYREAHDGYLSNYLATGQAKIIATGRKVSGLRKSGEIFPMHLGVSEVATPDGRRYVGLVHDLAEEERLRIRIDLLLREGTQG